MLSIGRLGAQSADYYLAQVAGGAEDYYLAGDQGAGRWQGAGADELDLEGRVAGDDLRAVLDGRDPADGAQLVRGPAAGRRTPGFDLTFSAPKSVSLIGALGSDQVRAQVTASHHRALGAAMAYLEDHAAFLRRGAGGVQRVPASGLVGASFTHYASRAGDPALHSHVLVANLAQDLQGRFGALDGRAIYRHAQTAGYLYQAELRHQLSRSLGLEFDEVRKGTAEIRGVPQEVIRAFSTRRAQIEERMAERGETSRRAAEMAALDTRQPKEEGLSAEGLAADWRARAEELGFGARQNEACLQRAVAREPDPAEIERLLDEVASPHGLTQHESSFTRREVIRTLAERSGSSGASAVGELADRFLASERVVLLGPEGELDEARCTTPELLATERELLETACDRQGEGSGQVAREIVDDVLASHPELSAEQEAIVAGLLGSGDGVQVVLGRAGSGKTYALAPARQAWEAAGYEVVGAALSARAAQGLSDGSGIPSQTLAGLLIQAAEPERSPLHAVSVVVLDEASMVGTRDLAALARHAEEAGAKLVLVGDHAQLREIAAGGLFRALAERLGALELSENRRQEVPWERAALVDVREGRAAEALAAYADHGRIHIAAGRPEAERALVADWLAAHRSGAEALMIAGRIAEVERLSRLARAELVACKEVGGPQRELPCGPVSGGDQVMMLRNDPGLGVQNGMRATVLGPAADGGLRVASDAGAIVELPTDYLEAGHLTYGYAITAHKAQGMTVDRAFVLASDGIDRQWGYTALSRARAETRLYVPHERPILARNREELGGHHVSVDQDPLARLAADLARDRSQEASFERLLGPERPLPKGSRGLILER